MPRRRLERVSGPRRAARSPQRTRSPRLIRITDELDNYRDLVSGTLDIYVSIVNNDLSRIMKRLTGVTVILAGIGAVAGIFGMSEAGAAFNGAEAGGFWLVTGAVVLLAIGAAA